MHYRIDEYGRRVSADTHPPKADKFILFYGCSFTYGFGVQDNETLPAYVGSLTAEYQPYNYGFGGFGPFDVLAKIETADFEHEVKEKNGISVYLFINGHIERLAGSMGTTRWSEGSFTYYEKDVSGVMVRKGTFESGRPWITRAYKILGRSRLLQRLRIDFPPRFTDAHGALLADTIEAMERGFKRHYPQGQFVMVIYPNSSMARLFLSKLAEKNIKVLDYTNLFDPELQEYKIRGERHPTALAYRTIARKLVEDLNLK
ncbi:MAG: hypothetical protein IT574_11635 [Candidatus Aureabacteria bacterium]|nr:hypothetical protein [Candidatus Auribacterota bacterium]HOE27620.1 hypothetical protein [bacterium]HQM51926.1 hypothetical protein [bacterium]